MDPVADRSAALVARVSGSYLLVSILSVLATMLGIVVDGVVIGNFLGSDALAAASLASPVFYTYAVLAGVLATGGTARCAGWVGRDRPDEVNGVFTLTLAVTVAVSVPLTLGGALFREPLAGFLGARGALRALTADYILGLSFGALPVLLAFVLMSFTRMDSSPRLSLHAVAVMIVVNGALDLLVVLVLGGGMLGIALATTASYAAATLVCATHFLRPRCTLRLARPRHPLAELAAATLIGLPDAASRLYSTLRTFVLNHLLLVLGGAVAVTAFSVRSNAYFLAGAVTLGVGQAIVPVVGVLFGEEDRTALRAALAGTLRAGSLLNLGAAALLYLLAGPFAALFGVRGPGAAAASVAAVRLFAVSMPLMLVNVTLMSFYQCTRSLAVANLVGAARSLVLVLGFAAALGGIVGVDGVWLAFVLAEAGTLLAVAVVVRRRAGRWPRSLDDWMLLPEGFGGRPGDVFELSVGNSLDEVLGLSRRIQAFCQGRGVDARRSALVALAVEEMAGNVVRHAFRPGEPRSFDVRLLVDGERLVLRVRDDGRRFHPFEHLAAQDPADRCSNVGIRLVEGLATSVDYRYSLGLNNLVVRL